MRRTRGVRGVYPINEAFLDEKASREGRRVLSKLKATFAADFPMRNPRVYCLPLNYYVELSKYFLKNFFFWPYGAYKREPSFLGIYDTRSFLLGEVPILLMGRADLATLQHEVRHHFSFECKRYPYADKKRAALDFLREYYWEERHSAIAEDKFRALKGGADEISRLIGEDEYEEALGLFENLSTGEFPENKHLPDALACIITEGAPWVSEGFASEESLAEAAKLPLKLFIGAATGGYLYTYVPLLFSAGPAHFLGLAYLSGGFLNLSYGFLRTLPLDLGSMRWRRMRAKIDDKDIPKVLAYPPTDNKTPDNILWKLRGYQIF